MSAAAENVIGGIIIGGRDAYWRVADVLTPQDFRDPGLCSLFLMLGEIAKSSVELDVITVMEEAERQGVMSASRVGEIAANTASAANIRSHAEVVKAAAMTRRVRAICAEGAKTGDVATVQAALTALLSSQTSSVVHAGIALQRMWDGVMARYESGDAISGLQTGFPLIDEMTGGLQPGRF